MTIVFSVFYFEYIHSLIFLSQTWANWPHSRCDIPQDTVKYGVILFSDEEEWKEGLVDHRQVSQEEAHKLEADVE